SAAGPRPPRARRAHAGEPRSGWRAGPRPRRWPAATARAGPDPARRAPRPGGPPPQPRPQAPNPPRWKETGRASASNWNLRQRANALRVAGGVASAGGAIWAARPIISVEQGLAVRLHGFLRAALLGRGGGVAGRRIHGAGGGAGGLDLVDGGRDRLLHRRFEDCRLGRARVLAGGQADRAGDGDKGE